MRPTELSSAGVTVVIPCYNYAHYLPQAIESCLSQGHEMLEVLVVDDDSTDDSVAVANAYGPPVRCIRQKNQGVGAARNLGMREAAHEFVIFLDADDMLAPGAVQSLLRAYMEAPEEPGVVAGCACLVDENAKSLGIAPHPMTFEGTRRVPLEEAIMFTPFVPTVLAKREFLLSLGGFVTDDRLYRGSEDKALWIDVAASPRPLLLLGTVTVQYRVHGQSMSHNGLRQLGSSQAVLEQAQTRFGEKLPRSSWNRTWAFSFFQAAIIYNDAGRYAESVGFLLRSFWLCPVIRHPTISMRYGSLFRSKRLVQVAGRWALARVRRPALREQ